MDYIIPTSTVSVRFIAEDAAAGSLIEAAVDDLMLWDEIPTGITDTDALAVFTLFPNPASDQMNFNIGLIREDNVQISVIDSLGQEIYTVKNTMPSGNNLFTLDVTDFPTGLYEVSLITSGSVKSQKFSIVR